MKTKLYSVVACLGAMSLAACVTSVSDDDGGGGSGNSSSTGGTGNTGNTGGSTGGGDAGGGGGDVGGGGAGGGAACVYCAEALSDANAPFCDAQAEDYFTALSDCICNTGCSAECGDNLCNADWDEAIPVECTDCYTGVACQQELTDCSNDVN